MTKNRAHKADIRAQKAVSGRSYTAQLRANGPGAEDESIPTVVVTRTSHPDGDVYEFWCEYCKQPHTHGANGPPSETPGHRNAHCVEPGSPYLRTGYMLVVETRVGAEAEMASGIDAAHIGTIVDDTWALLEERLQTKRLTDGVPTGFAALDTLTCGLQPSALIVLAAMPKAGKRSLALDIVRNVATQARRPVGIFSLDISKDLMGTRLISSEAGVNSRLLKTGQASSDDFEHIARAMDTLKKSGVWIDDTPSLTVAELHERARRIQNEHGVHLIVIDHLQLIHGAGPGSTWQDRSDVVNGLKALAVVLNVPVVVLSTLSPEPKDEKRPPQLSDLRDAGRIDRVADVVLLLDRPGLRGENVDASAAGLLVVSNRYGPTAKLDLTFIASTTNFEDVAPKDIQLTQ